MHIESRVENVVGFFVENLDHVIVYLGLLL